MSEQLAAFIVQLPASEVAEIERRASLAGMTIEHFLSLVITLGLTLRGDGVGERSER